MNLIGKTILIYDVASGSVRDPFIDEYEIEDLNRTVIIRRKLPPMELDFS